MCIFSLMPVMWLPPALQSMRRIHGWTGIHSKTQETHNPRAALMCIPCAFLFEDTPSQLKRAHETWASLPFQAYHFIKRERTSQKSITLSFPTCLDIINHDAQNLSLGSHPYTLGMWTLRGHRNLAQTSFFLIPSGRNCSLMLQK
jgi:hypothetical protein